jgi:hypothetical protein
MLDLVAGKVITELQTAKRKCVITFTSNQMHFTI